MYSSRLFGPLDLEALAEKLGQFRLGRDEVTLVSGASAYWRVVIPPATTPAALLSRVLETYDGGSILYKVFTEPSGTPTPTPILLPPSNAQVTFERVTGVTDAGSTLRDSDWIPASGTGNNATGGAAGGQRLRIQPPDAVFYLKMTNNSNGSRTCALELGWIEGWLAKRLI